MKVKIINLTLYTTPTKGDVFGKTFEAEREGFGYCIRNGEFTKQGIIFDKDDDPDDFTWSFISSMVKEVPEVVH